MSSLVGQVFLQSMLSRGALTAVDTLKLYREVSAELGEGECAEPIV